MPCIKSWHKILLPPQLMRFSVIGAFWYKHDLKRFLEILGLNSNRHINSNIEGTISHSKLVLNAITLELFIYPQTI